MTEEILLTKDQFEAWSTYGDEAWQPFRDAWLARGFRLPPSGSEEDDVDTSLRSRLWRIADARPNDLGRWVAEADRGSSPYEVIAYVFERWSGLRTEAGIEDDEALEVRARLSRTRWQRTDAVLEPLVAELRRIADR